MSKTSVLSTLALVALVLSATTGLRPPLAKAQEPPSYRVVTWGTIDVFNQKGGKGHLVSSPPFCPEDPILLYASVTYCEWPEQNCDVALQILDPCNRLFLLVGRTNASGIAAVSFRLPSSEYADRVPGAWRVLVTASVAGVVVSDTLEFCAKWKLADVNADGKVDVSDAVAVSLAYTATLSDPRWDQNCDVAKTYGIIDLYDIAVLATNYGKACMPPV